MIDFNLLLATLANKRPVFHSEADFQHALAWELQLLYPNVNIRLEYRPPWLDRRNYMDIWVIDEDTAIAVELKYKTRSVDISIGHEQFALQNQAAQDLGRYDFVKDIERLERVVAAGRQVVGYAIILTNDSTYWNLPRKNDSVDADFRIYEGRVLSGLLSWDPRASEGTRRGRTDSIHLTDSYRLGWRSYSDLDGPQHMEFRYALVQVSNQHTVALQGK
jgi:hypothetical protein